MKTDRELLELAARAAGITGEWTDNHIEYNYQYDYSFDPVIGIVQEGEIWNPLTDDGDALRLAVKLGMLVDATSFSTTVLASDFIHAAEKHNGDPYAATRRAIVRAAAVGEGMKESLDNQLDT